MLFKKKSSSSTPITDKLDHYFAKKKEVKEAPKKVVEEETLGAIQPHNDYVFPKITLSEVWTTASESETRDTSAETETVDEQEEDRALEVPNSTINNIDKSGSLLDEAEAAIQELERVLFFTDVPEGEDAREEQQKALQDLKRVASVSSSQAHQRSNSTSTALAKPSSTTVALTKAVEALQARVQHTLSECERTVLFTDLDQRALSKERAGVDIFHEIELLVRHLEKNMAAFALQKSQQVQKAYQEQAEQVQKAYKECERTLLFTDLDEQALANDTTPVFVFSSVEEDEGKSTSSF